ncbi:MAG: hypothetical protein HN368_10335 [Spirochaetales bacterium]|jgi:tartrate/fumarate subfamily iron-sulfur-dependent hydro-lyase beta chain|nr:hypothetical protein [Spirochaetales bacterium]
MNEYHLKSPLTTEEIRELKIGDIVCLTGKAFTCRSKLQRAVFDEDVPLPRELLDNDILIHVGPIVLRKEENYRLVSFMPTSSVRFEKWGSRSIRDWGLKVIVGKTTMGDQTAKTMAELGCVHLSPRSVSPNLWVKSIKVESVFLFDEMGSIEAPWQLSVNELGPFVVDIDTHGGRLYKELQSSVQQRLSDAYRRLKIPDDFRYTKLQ